jgi:hypothetical protein
MRIAAIEGHIMKKIVGAAFALALGITSLPGTASATPAGLTYTGVTGVSIADPANFGVIEGAHILTVAGTISTLIGQPVVYLGRFSEAGGIVDPYGVLPVLLNGASITGTFNPGGLSGTWAFNSGDYGFDVVAVEIDAGDFWGGSSAKYYSVDNPALDSGNWDTSDFIPAVRRTFDYVDLYGVLANRAPVPEPMSLMLLGGGLAGFGFMRRKKRA